MTFEYDPRFLHRLPVASKIYPYGHQQWPYNYQEKRLLLYLPCYGCKGALRTWGSYGTQFTAASESHGLRGVISRLSLKVIGRVTPPSPPALGIDYESRTVPITA